MRLNCILLVDDDPATNFLHRLAAIESGLVGEIREALSAESALDYLRQSLRLDAEDYPPPELILLDVNLPGLNSWQMLQLMREESLAMTPIICIASTLDHPSHREHAQRFPEIKDFFSKPLSKNDFAMLIERHFR